MNQLAFIVEDDPDLSAIFSLAVQNAGYDARVFFDGRAALAQMGQTPPALVVLDLHIPGRSGPEVLDQIRVFIDGQIQVIVCTADPGLAATLRDQVEHILIKPIRFSQLRDLAAELRNVGSKSF